MQKTEATPSKEMNTGRVSPRAFKPDYVKMNIEEVVIGTGDPPLTIGGERALPFLKEDGALPHPVATALEIWDVKPQGWSPYLQEVYEKVWHDPVKWAEYVEKETPASALFLRIMSLHPDYQREREESALTVFKHILDKVSLPLIVTGTGIAEIDKILMPKLAEAGEGRNLLLGNATAENYREITASCIKYDHSLITESPIDINIAKQVNILVSDAGLPKNRMVMYATTGALGYGFEYAYSIMEKSRLFGLAGDTFMNKPQMALVGQETWRTKESGISRETGISWETVTALGYIHAGADLVVLRHPRSLEVGNRRSEVREGNQRLEDRS